MRSKTKQAASQRSAGPLLSIFRYRLIITTPVLSNIKQSKLQARQDKKSEHTFGEHGDIIVFHKLSRKIER